MGSPTIHPAFAPSPCSVKLVLVDSCGLPGHFLPHFFPNLRGDSQLGSSELLLIHRAGQTAHYCVIIQDSCSHLLSWYGNMGLLGDLCTSLLPPCPGEPTHRVEWRHLEFWTNSSLPRLLTPVLTLPHTMEFSNVFIPKVITQQTLKSLYQRGGLS